MPQDRAKLWRQELTISGGALSSGLEVDMLQNLDFARKRGFDVSKHKQWPHSLLNRAVQLERFSTGHTNSSYNLLESFMLDTPLCEVCCAERRR